MMLHRPSAARGHADHGWLDSHHTFSFADYYDPKHMGFRSLRVINEDRVAPGAGFPTHPHRDMEIISYVLGGAIAHKDSMGNGSVIYPGEVQRMTAGTGVTHSEFNALPDEPLHFLQIWIVPAQRGLPPSYEQKVFADHERANRWRLVASSDGRDGSVTIHQDASLFSTLLVAGESLEHRFAPGRHGWLQLVSGTLSAAGLSLSAGDGLAISDEASLVVTATTNAHALLFELA